MPNTGFRACGLRWLWCSGSAAPRHVESSRTGDQTCIPCISRGILNVWTAREDLRLCIGAQTGSHSQGHGGLAEMIIAATAESGTWGADPPSSTLARDNVSPLSCRSLGSSSGLLSPRAVTDNTRMGINRCEREQSHPCFDKPQLSGRISNTPSTDPKCFLEVIP